MEGVHMVAGPWFTVRDSERRDWQSFGQVWASDGGAHDGAAELQLKLTLLPPSGPQEVANAG